MAKKCALCGKGSKIVWRRVKLRGKYNPTTKRRQYPNLQWMKLASGKRAMVCARCIKAKSKKK